MHRYAQRGKKAVLAMFIAVLVCACTPLTSLEVHLPELTRWTGNFDYSFFANDYTVANTIIYYKLVQEENNYWCYPVSEILSPIAQEETTPGSLPLQAVNNTLSEICSLLNFTKVSAIGLWLQQNTAMLNLPSSFYEYIEAQKGNFPGRALEALVLTLTEFSEVDSVQFLRRGSILSFVTVDMGPFDISRPISRPYPNDALASSGQGEKVVLYWQLRGSYMLLPLTHTFSQGAASVQVIQDLLSENPLLRRNQSEQVDLSALLCSPLTPVFTTDGSNPWLSLHSGTLFIDLSSDIFRQQVEEEQILVALISLTRTMLGLREVQQVQWLVDGRVVVLSLERLSLAEPFTTLPFINLID